MKRKLLLGVVLVMAVGMVWAAMSKPDKVDHYETVKKCLTTVVNKEVDRNPLLEHYGAMATVMALNAMDEFLKKEYHNVPKKEFKKYVFLEAMRKARSDGLTEEETYLFHDDHEKVRMVRKAIEYFDEMDVEGQQGKLDSTTVVYFLKWCAVEKGKEKSLYQYFCDNYKGRYKLLVWSAVSKTRKEQRELGITDRGAADSFQKMMESINKEVAVV